MFHPFLPGTASEDDEQATDATIPVATPSPTSARGQDVEDDGSPGTHSGNSSRAAAVQPAGASAFHDGFGYVHSLLIIYSSPPFAR